MIGTKARKIKPNRGTGIVCIRYKIGRYKKGGTIYSGTGNHPIAYGIAQSMHVLLVGTSVGLRRSTEMTAGG